MFVGDFAYVLLRRLRPSEENECPQVLITLLTCPPAAGPVDFHLNWLTSLCFHIWPCAHSPLKDISPASPLLSYIPSLASLPPEQRRSPQWCFSPCTVCPHTSYDLTPHIQPVSLPQGRHLPDCASSSPSPHWVCVCSTLSLNDRPLHICRASHQRLPQVLLTCHLITKTDFMFSYLKLYHPHMVTFWVLPLPLACLLLLPVH